MCVCFYFIIIKKFFYSRVIDKVLYTWLTSVQSAYSELYGHLNQPQFFM